MADAQETQALSGLACEKRHLTRAQRTRHRRKACAWRSGNISGLVSINSYPPPPPPPGLTLGQSQPAFHEVLQTLLELDDEDVIYSEDTTSLDVQMDELKGHTRNLVESSPEALAMATESGGRLAHTNLGLQYDFEECFFEVLENWFQANDSLPMSEVASMCQTNAEIEKMKMILRNRIFRGNVEVNSDGNIVLREDV